MFMVNLRNWFPIDLSRLKSRPVKKLTGNTDKSVNIHRIPFEFGLTILILPFERENREHSNMHFFPFSIGDQLWAYELWFDRPGGIRL